MNFLSELSRRNVIRIAGLYAIIGWIIVQVIATTAPMLGLPEWFATAVLVLLMAGFPIVALGAWAFDLTPEGIKREESLGADVAPPAPRLVDYSILGGIAVIIAVGIWISVMRPPAPFAETSPTLAANETDELAADIALANAPIDDRTSIAVLAFEDLSQDQDQEYFADGISEEILNLLVRVEGLQVASRTSSFQFKGRSLGVREIADDLGVGHVLEGSVRRSGDRLRITAQLIDARTDRHLWSENFDRDMTDIFVIQDEIADAIVTALADSLGLSPEEANVDVVAATENLDAYDAFIRARELFLRRSNLPEVARLLEHAVELDPDYVEAWEILALAYVVMPAWVELETEEEANYYTLATTAANRAIEINPDRSMAYAALGAANSNGRGTISVTMEYLYQALAQDPRNIVALDWRSVNLLNLGYFDAAVADLLLCLDIDPGYTKCRSELIQAYYLTGENELALETTYQTLAEGYPNPNDAVLEVLMANGRREEAMWVLGSEIGYGAPLGPMVDAMMNPSSVDIDDVYAQVVAYSAANSETLGATGLYYLAAKIGIDPLPDLNFPMMTELNLWYPHLAGIRQSDLFINAISEFGVVDYWRENGFPPQCRPLEGDDFECD